MSDAPRVSVLLPVYNGGIFLAEALDSVLAQTLEDWELLVIDDGSTDGSAAVLSHYEQLDRRVRVYTQENCGVIMTLNRGLALVRGTYLARLDADDVWLPERLERGLALLERDPGLVIVGSAYYVVDNAGQEVRVHRPPADSTSIDWEMLFHNAFCNSAVLVRTATLAAEKALRYNPEAKHAEDFELWSRLLERGRGANLSEPLVKYRLHGQQDSQTHATEQWASANEIAQRNLARVGVRLAPDDVATLRRWYYAMPAGLAPEDLRLCGVLLGLLARFARRPGESAAATRRLRRTLFRRILAAAAGRYDDLWRSGLVVRMARMDPIGFLRAAVRCRTTWRGLGPTEHC